MACRALELRCRIPVDAGLALAFDDLYHDERVVFLTKVRLDPDGLWGSGGQLSDVRKGVTEGSKKESAISERLRPFVRAGSSPLLGTP